RWPRDWSSDVCSSDLQLSDELFGGYGKFEEVALRDGTENLGRGMFDSVVAASVKDFDPGDKLAVAAGLELCCRFAYLPLVEYARSEERRVGKECRSRV